MVYPNLLVNGRTRSLIRIRINNNGFGPEFWRPKNKGVLWIRIRNNAYLGFLYISLNISYRVGYIIYFDFCHFISLLNLCEKFIGTMALLILFGLVGGLVYLRRNNLEFLFNKNTWCMLAMFFVLSMIRFLFARNCLFLYL